MKLAVAQTFVSHDIAANGSAIRAAIAEAAAQGAGLVAFCEGALSGYVKLQIKDPAEWENFGWAVHEAELRTIATLCGELGIFAVVGAAHRLPNGRPPHNSLYIFSAAGALLTRYDKRFLSNSELGGWYTPGTKPIVVEVDGCRLGCAICIESQFPEVFSEYERMGVDGVIFASYGVPPHFQIALRAHGGLNCIWIAAATPAQKAGKGPAGIIGPDGEWVVQCCQTPEADLALAVLDRNDPAYDIPLQKARPWRAKARQGDIYREQLVDDPRSHARDEY